MTTTELLDAAKTASNSASDYALAKRLGISTGAIADVRHGKRGLPLDAAYRLAIILDRDPAQVVAELEAERETNSKKADFWRSFLSRAAMLVLMVCTLGLSSSSTSDGAAAKAAFGNRRKFA